MPAKLNTICYVHNIAERLTQDFTVKEITGITRTKDDDPTKVIYLKIKAFIPSDQNIESKIEDFENGQIVIIKGKFIGCDGWYTVNATSIKPLSILDFNDMPSIGLNVTLVGSTTKTVMNINGYSTLNFYVEESLGNREPTEFWVEARHDPNNRYLANKTNSINQNMRSTTAILVGVIYYVPPIINEITQEETTEGKHVLELEDISLISTNRNNNTSQQSPNLPWMSQQGSNNNRSYRPPRGATSRRRGRTTLAQMESTNTQNLSAALEANPIPTNMNQIPNNETSEENDN